ncbi:methylosome protein 50-like [Mya arenaria]|uniref:methylosome protein 50-like n=1 Tax=Mya arenaria TaxID=6604 RepID=UPI0022E5DC29|nr:methylosome protein 50-like [Mya arenaria]
MDQVPAAMDRHFEVIHYHKNGGILLGASSLTGRYWFGSIWYFEDPGVAPDVEKCTAGVQLEAGLSDACWLDQTRVLVGMDTGGLALWELTDNLHTFVEQSSAVEHDDIVSSVCVCAGGSNLLSASYDRSVKVWDQETLQSIHTYRGHSDVVHCVCGLPSQSDVFLTASQDGNVCLWDTRKPKPVSRLNKSPLQSLPTCVAWQPGEEHTYVVGGECGSLVVKDTRAAVSDHITLRPHHRPVTRVSFQTDRSSTLASVSEDCTVVVVDIAEQQPKQLYRSTAHKDFVRGVSWANDGTSIEKLITCGWDSNVISHLVPRWSKSNDPAAGDQVKMEVNGEPAETQEVKGSNSGRLATKIENVVNGNGDADLGDLSQVNTKAVVETPT